MAKKKAAPAPAAPTTPVSDNHQMSLDFDGLMRVLANALYSEKKVFIRELVQNGHDSVRRRQNRDRQHSGRIDIDTRPDESRISFTDNGIGMSADDLRQFLSTIGASGTKKQGLLEESVTGLVGQFGIGFLSGFIIAERVEVRTRKINEQQGWLWKSAGKQTYTITPCAVENVGTTVTVFVKDPADRGLIEPDAVVQVVREYCDMLRVPIHVNRGTTAVNSQIMPWERDGVSDDERELDCRIYLAKTIRGDNLIETFPVRIDDPFKTGGILYISKMRSFGVRVPRNVRIYQDRMFVANDADLLPPWAEFVSGIIETSGLTPNAARDGFIKNAAWGQLREALGELIIRGLDRLRNVNRKQLAYILKYHDLGIKAACKHHEPFFRKFAHLLEWRVNRLPTSDPTNDDDGETLDLDLRSGGVSYHWRTLPEVLAATKSQPGRPTRLLAFTTSNAANQYFDMANAEGVQVVDASYPFEDDLIAAYAKLPDVPPIELIYVDRQQSGVLFQELQADDQSVRRLADMMSQVIQPGRMGRLKVEARRFQPITLPAVLQNAERGRAEQQAREILGDPNQPSHLREMAEELLRNSRTSQSMRMTINAACTFIQELAAQDPQDADIRHLMLGVYNSAILYNAEMLTPRNAKIFHDQFGEFMESNLKMVREGAAIKQERSRLEKERQELRRLSGVEEPQAKHRILFLMTPFNDDYLALERALRSVVEERWRCQLFLARDRMFENELRGNVDAHMRQAHAFLAEVSLGNPNVMYEVGRAQALHPSRPMVILSHPHKETKKIDLPVDLAGLLRLEYDLDAAPEMLADHLEKELRKFQAISDLLDGTQHDAFIPASKLPGWSRPITLYEKTFAALGRRFSTAEAWRTATASQVHDIVKDDGLDADDAASLLRKIQKGIQS